MATDRTNIGNKFQNTDIPSEADFKEIFDSFVHKDEDKADFQMVETGTDTDHYVTPALLRTGLQNIGIITGNSFMPHKENFEDSFSGTILPLTYFPIPKSVKVFKNGQLLQEGPDYTVNYDTAQINFLETVTDRNLEVDYWYKNLSPSPGSGSGAAIDFTSFLHTSGNETKNGLLTFNNTTATSTSGIILKNNGAAAGATSLDVTNSGAGSGISLQNSSTGTGVKVSNAGTGVAVNVNSEPGSTGDILQVSKNNVVTAKIDSEGNLTAKKFVTSGGTDLKFVKGDGSLDPTTYADDTTVIHTEGNESKDGALTLTHDNGLPEDVLTIIKNNSANCLKLVQNSSSNATTSTFDTTTADNNRKAISIQKVEQEKAFITHDGNVSGTSFTTLNEKADITDGFLTLGTSTSPAATAGHAKLYAKTNGTTDMYVMGSDGVEKKIGASGDLDNVLHKTGFATETKTGELVIDSGANGVSGLVLTKLPTTVNNSTYSTGLDNDYNLCKLPNGDVLTQSARSPYNVSKTPSGGGIPTLYNVTSYNATSYLKSLPNGDVLLSNSNGTNVEKIPFGGGTKVVYSAERKYDDIVILANGDFLGVLDTTVYKVPFGGGTSTVYATGFTALRRITDLPNGDVVVVDGYNGSMTLYKIPFGGGSKTVYLSGNYTFQRFASFSNGDILFSNLNVVYKVPFGGGTPSIYASGFSDTITGLVILNSNEILVGQLSTIIKVSGSSSKNVLTTDSTGKVIKTTYLEDIAYLKASDVDLSTYAKLSSPIFTGVPSAPTAILGTNTTQIATTAFVLSNATVIPHLEYNSTDKTIWNNGKSNIFDNTSFGQGALKAITTGNQSTAFGYQSSTNLQDGNFNASFGYNSLSANISGLSNTAIGAYAFRFLSSGSDNVSIGMMAGDFITSNSANSTTNQSVYIGSQSKSLAVNQTNEIVIGYNAIGNGSNTVTLGNSLVTNTYLKGVVNFPSSTTPTSTTNTAKIYAKTSGTTDMYVMGSDGIEIKIGGSTTDLSPYAKLVSPIFSGIPTAPTAAIGANTTQIATTAFVKNALPESGLFYPAVISSINHSGGSPFLAVNGAIYTRIGNVISCRIALRAFVVDNPTAYSEIILSLGTLPDMANSDTNAYLGTVSLAETNDNSKFINGLVSFASFSSIKVKFFP